MTQVETTPQPSGGRLPSRPSRRGLLGVVGGGAAATLASTRGLGHAEEAPAASPEIQLIEAYDNWFIEEGTFLGPLDKMRAGLPHYITNKTVLHEPPSLPWGGVMIGYDGWERLCRISGPIWKVLLPLAEISAPTYYQNGPAVMHEINISIKATASAPEPFAMGLVEKFVVHRGRIVEIDEYYADTAGLMKKLTALGTLPNTPV